MCDKRFNMIKNQFCIRGCKKYSANWWFLPAKYQIFNKKGVTDYGNTFNIY